MNREESERMADALLLQERRESLERQPWRARVPMMLRCDELHDLEAHERVAIVRDAQAQAHDLHSLTYGVAVLLIAVSGAMLLMATGGPSFDGWLAAYFVAVLAPFIGYARFVVKPLVKERAMARAREIQRQSIRRPVDGTHPPDPHKP